MHARRVAMVAALLACLLAAACSASTRTEKATAPVGPPSTTAPSSSAPPLSASPTATPTPSQPKKTKPLSPFENDPGIQAVRAWMAQAARTVNTGHDNSAALRALMTASFSATMKNILGTEIGRHYPGPIPYQPLRVTVVSATSRTSQGCLISRGFAQNPTTHKPAGKRIVLPVELSTVHRNGRWLVNNLVGPVALSCKHVKIRTVTW